MDFPDLKNCVQTAVLNDFDHALVLNSAVKTGHAPSLQGHFGNVIYVDYQPTNENLLTDFAQRITSKLPNGVSLVRLKMYETNSSFAEWTP
jgi:6-pyruvoyltetrahydropterin/6-carboxytetrahydropterin synthase